MKVRSGGQSGPLNLLCHAEAAGDTMCIEGKTCLSTVAIKSIYPPRFCLTTFNQSRFNVAVSASEAWSVPLSFATILTHQKLELPHKCEFMLQSIETP